jgi:hypothetical protein
MIRFPSTTIGKISQTLDEKGDESQEQFVEQLPLSQRCMQLIKFPKSITTRNEIKAEGGRKC